VTGAPGAGGLRVLAVDDERPALDELTYLLSRDERVAQIVAHLTPAAALRELATDRVDAVFLDVSMPGLTGLEVAAALRGQAAQVPPPVVFVTAHEAHAARAFDLHAVDYVLKPVRAERLAEAVRRVVAHRDGVALRGSPATPGAPRGAVPDLQIPVERGGVTRFVDRSAVTHVEAQGDYARLHTATDSHLVRVALSTLEQDWAEAGFARIHRSLLVALAHVTEVRTTSGRCVVVVGPPGTGTELGVSRRHTRELRERLAERGRSPGPGTP